MLLKKTPVIFREFSFEDAPIAIIPYVTDGYYNVLHLNKDLKFEYADFYTTIKSTNAPKNIIDDKFVEMRKYLKYLGYRVFTIEEVDETMFLNNIYAAANKLQRLQSSN